MLDFLGFVGLILGFVAWRKASRAISENERLARELNQIRQQMGEAPGPIAVPAPAVAETATQASGDIAAQAATAQAAISSIPPEPIAGHEPTLTVVTLPPPVLPTVSAAARVQDIKPPMADTPSAPAPLVSAPLVPAPEPVSPVQAVAPPDPAPAAPEPRLEPAASVAADSTVGQAADSDAERVFATKWAVWIGGVALAMGGLLTVKYSIEAGFFGPGVRLMMGAAFALALAVTSEVIRRRDLTLNAAKSYADQIPAVLAGVSVLSAFGVAYAAHAVHGFIGPALAFTMMGAIGLAALAASLLHGPRFALFGLVGSYATPIMISGVEPNYMALSIFVAIVTTAAFFLHMRRPSTALLAGAVIGHAIWTGLIAFGPHVWGWGSFLLILAVVLALLQSEYAERSGERRVTEADKFAALTALAALAAPLVLAGFLWVEFGGGLNARLTLAVLVAGNIVAAMRYRGMAPLAPLAGAAAVGLILLWPDLNGPLRITPHLIFELVSLNLVPHAAPGLSLFAILLGSLVSVPLLASLMMPWRNGHGDVISRGCIAFASALAPVCMMLSASLRLNGFNRTDEFALIAAVLALGFAAISELLFRKERERTQDAADPLSFVGSAAFAAAGAIAVGLAIAFALRETWLVVGFAVASGGVALVARRRPIPLLRTICASLGTAALARVVWQPTLTDLGEWPIVNWLMVVYGLPALAFAVAAWALAQRRDRALKVVEGLAAFFLSAFVIFEIIQAFVGGNLWDVVLLFSLDGFVDVLARQFNRATALVALLIIAAAGLGALYMTLKRRLESPIFAGAEALMAIAAVALSVVGLGLFLNPALNGIPILDPLFLNRMLFGYLGLAFVLALIASVLPRRPADEHLQATLEFVAIVIGVLGAVLLLRHGFTGPDMSIRWFTSVGFYEAVATALLLLVSAAVVALWRDRRDSMMLGKGLVGVVVVAAGYVALMLGLVKNPMFDHSLVEGPILFNRLLWGYGPVAAGFIGFAYWTRQSGRPPYQIALLAGGATTALMSVLLIRHGFHGATLFSDLPITLAEAGIYGSLALIADFLRTRVRQGRTETPAGDSSFVSLAALAIALYLFVLLIAVAGGARLVGWPVVNNSIPALLLPAFLAAAMAWWGRSVGLKQSLIRFYGSAAAIGGGAYALLQIRFAFHGVTLGSDTALTLAEAGIYGSLALIADFLRIRIQQRLAEKPAGDPNYVSFAVLAIGFYLVALLVAVDSGARLVGWPVLNNSIPALLLPAFLAAAMAWWCRSAGFKRPPTRLYGIAAVIGGGAYALLQVRFAFHGVTLISETALTLAEAGTYGSLALIAGYFASRALMARGGANDEAPLVACATVAVGVPVGLLGIAALEGATLHGWLIFNNSILGLLAPTMLAAALSLWTRKAVQAAIVSRIYGVAAVSGGLLYALLQVRFAIPGAEGLGDFFSSNHGARLYGYSLVIIGYGTALLIAGFRMANRDLRIAALVIVGLAIVKVFLLDLRDLEGLWRASSFIGLGICLIGIAYLYRWLEPDSKARKA
jgi:uncharacterized membrane protein